MVSLKDFKRCSSLDPQRPKPLDNVMNLYYLYIPPYTFTTNNVKITPINNRRYTMRDIGRLEQRLKECRILYSTFFSRAK